MFQQEEHAFQHGKEQDSHALAQAKIEATDRRWARWILFILGILVFLFALIGTVFRWTGADYLLAVIVSGVAGNLIGPRIPFISDDQGSLPPIRRGLP